MRSKRSILEKVQSVLRIGHVAAGFVLAVLGWLADHAPKKRGSGETRQALAAKPQKRQVRQTAVKNWKERSGMPGGIGEFLTVLVEILAGIGVLVGGYFGIRTLLSRWKANKDKADPVIPFPGTKTAQTKVPPQTPPPTVSYMALRRRKFELEQKMAGEVGGPTGMAVLLENIRAAEKKGKPDGLYRDSYCSKQQKLRTYMDEYREVLRQAQGAPEDMKEQLRPVKDLEQYQKLLNERV